MINHARYENRTTKRALPRMKATRTIKQPGDAYWDSRLGWIVVKEMKQ
jgi:hypothetical protein